MISCTGYTGERCYNILCSAKDAPFIWGAIILESANMIIEPMQVSTMDWLRVKCYLLFYPGNNLETSPFADEGCGDTIWELGLEFTVSPNKVGFIGAENHYKLKGKERFKIYGVKWEGTFYDYDKPKCMTKGSALGLLWRDSTRRLVLVKDFVLMIRPYCSNSNLV